MACIAYRDKRLHVEGVAVSDIVREVGTPVYIYSKKQLVDNFRAYQKAFRSIPHLICYAVKANANLAVLKTLAQEGSGADIVSGGELRKALKAKIPPSRIVFAGVGKTEQEMNDAIRRRILMFNVESGDELLLLSRIALDHKDRVPVSLRLNPDINPKTHPYISTGLNEHKFGIPIHEALELYKLAASHSKIAIVGMHMHLGSQIQTIHPFSDALNRIVLLIDELSKRGIPIRFLDIGGGVGIDYEKGSNVLKPHHLAEVVKQKLAGRKVTLIIEPGRSIAADAGILVTRVLYKKTNQNKKFVIVDAGMNDMIRPSLYGAYHKMIPVETRSRSSEVVTIAGPVCESADFFAKDRRMPKVQVGELLAMLDAGAYGFSMSSNYNSRLRPAEVFVDEKHFQIVRKRETYRDLIRNEL